MPPSRTKEKHQPFTFFFPQLKITKQNYVIRAEEFRFVRRKDASLRNITWIEITGSPTCRQSLMYESLRILSGPVGSISIIMYLLVSCLSFLRMLRMVFGPRRERNHPKPPSCPLTEDSNTFPDICICLHCFQFNQPFSHKFKKYLPQGLFSNG